MCGGGGGLGGSFSHWKMRGAGPGWRADPCWRVPGHRVSRRLASPMGERVVIVGGGAREHALAWACTAGGHEVVLAPGNAGTESIGRNVNVGPDDVSGLVDLATSVGADLVVVGPDLPLQLGLVDALAAKGVRAFGPTQRAARLEGAKAFMKRFCERNGIPTAPFAVFEDPDAAERHVRRAARPPVVKADGLAAGKAVIVPDTVAEACAPIDKIMRKRAFAASARIVMSAVRP